MEQEHHNKVIIIIGVIIVVIILILGLAIIVGKNKRIEPEVTQDNRSQNQIFIDSTSATQPVSLSDPTIQGFIKSTSAPGGGSGRVNRSFVEETSVKNN